MKVGKACLTNLVVLLSFVNFHVEVPAIHVENDSIVAFNWF